MQLATIFHAGGFGISSDHIPLFFLYRRVHIWYRLKPYYHCFSYRTISNRLWPYYHYFSTEGLRIGSNQLITISDTGGFWNRLWPYCRYFPYRKAEIYSDQMLTISPFHNAMGITEIPNTLNSRLFIEEYDLTLWYWFPYYFIIIYWPSY